MRSVKETSLKIHGSLSKLLYSSWGYQLSVRGSDRKRGRRRTAAADQDGVDVVKVRVDFFVHDVVFGDFESGFRVSSLLCVGFSTVEEEFFEKTAVAAVALVASWLRGVAFEYRDAER